MIDREMKTTINNWILQGKEAFLLTGARQIGKTYLIRECLKESKYDYVELNFIERPELVELFENATNAQDLLMRLSLITDKQMISIFLVLIVSRRKCQTVLQVSVVNVLFYTRKVLNKQKVSLTFCAKQKLLLIHWLI